MSGNLGVDLGRRTIKLATVGVRSQVRALVEAARVYRPGEDAAPTGSD